MIAERGLQWQRIVTRHAGVRAAYAMDGQRIQLQISGVISPRSWVDLATEAHRTIRSQAGRDSVVLCVDLTAAVVAISEADVPELASKLIAAASATDLPGALLVSEACEPIVRCLALEIAQRAGIERGLFSDAQACEAWIERRIALELLCRADEASSLAASQTRPRLSVGRRCDKRWPAQAVSSARLRR